MFSALTKVCDAAVYLRVRAEHIRVVSTCCSPSSRKSLTQDLDTPDTPAHRRSSEQREMRQKTFILRGQVQDCREHIPIRMLVDSGSSDSFVALSFVLKHHIPMRRSRKRHMICAAGQRASILGMVDLSLFFEGRRLNGEFLVVKNIDHYTPIILGDDILRATRAVLDYGACMVTIRLRDDTVLKMSGCKSELDSETRENSPCADTNGHDSKEQKLEGPPDPRA